MKVITAHFLEWVVLKVLSLMNGQWNETCEF